MTQAAYFASRYVIVPIKPEFMATIGLPLLARSLQDFRLENENHEIEIAGLVFNHSSSYSAGPEGQQAIEDVTKVVAEEGWHIFENQVRYSSHVRKIGARAHAAVADELRPRRRGKGIAALGRTRCSIRSELRWEPRRDPR